MPDKYEFRRYADNLNHPWFNDIKLDFQQLSLNRILLCLLCVLLMNIDEHTFFHDITTLPHNNTYNKTNKKNNSHIIKELSSNAITLYNQGELILSSNKSYHKQCNKQKHPYEYLGSKKKNVFHTQLMIGVIFGFMMKCRIPILFSFINIIIKSGCSFKPKIIPQFIDNKTLKPHTFYGSSYRLLNNKMNFELLNIDINNINYDSDSSESDDECSDSDIDEDDTQINYNFINNQLPKHLFGE